MCLSAKVPSAAYTSIMGMLVEAVTPPRCAASHDHAISLRSSAAAGHGGVVGRAEAAMEVVVDHADVLHERVHARGPHEAVPLRLQLLRERLRLRGRLGRSATERGARLRVS